MSENEAFEPSKVAFGEKKTKSYDTCVYMYERMRRVCVCAFLLSVCIPFRQISKHIS